MERYDELKGKGSFISDVGAKVIDSAVQAMAHGQKPCINELLEIELPGDPEGRMLCIRMIDPSTGRAYVERVHPQLCPLPDPADPHARLGAPQPLTVRNALASRIGLRGDSYILAMES